MFFDYATALIILLCGTRIYVYCDDEVNWKIDSHPQKQHGLIVLSNHRTRVDWMYVGWSYAYFLSNTSHMKIVLKHAIKNVPFFGWGCQLISFIFLTRERHKDIPHIQKSLRCTLEYEKSPSLLIFPEGTDLSETNVIKSNKFIHDLNQKRAELKAANGNEACGAAREVWDMVDILPRKYVLYPKTSGTICAINEFKRFYQKKGRKNVVEPKYNGDSGNSGGVIIHDVTVAYRDHTPGKRTSDTGLLLGEFPTEIHLHIQRRVLPLQHDNDPTSQSMSREGVDASSTGGQVDDAGALEQVLQCTLFIIAVHIACL